jgi:dolichol kinase
LNELGRQLIHIFFGLGFVAFGAVFGKTALVELLIAAVVIGLLLIQLKLVGTSVAAVDWVLANFERRDSGLPGKGALFYFTGALLLVSFAQSFKLALAILAILAVADGVATIAGIHLGGSKLEWHPSKTWAGTLSFVAFGTAAAFPLIGLYSAFFYAVALAAIESIDVGIDDNLLIPAAALGIAFYAPVLGVV